MTITPEDVLAVMPRGRANGVTVRTLAFAVADLKMRSGDKGVSWGTAAQRKVRAAVESLRRDGHPICATPEDGYYLANNDEELSRTIAFLRSRAMTSLVQIAQLRRVSLPVLMGQLQIELVAAEPAEQLAAEPSSNCVRLRDPDKPLIWSMCKHCDGGPCTEAQQ